MMTDSEFRAVLDLASRWTDRRTVGVDCKERPTHRLITMVNGGHPVDGRQGWDLMEIDRITSVAERDRLALAAESKYWAIHSKSEDRIVLYKPTGAQAPWGEDGEAQTDRLIALSMGA